jgi:hypothetical protein
MLISATQECCAMSKTLPRWAPLFLVLLPFLGGCRRPQTDLRLPALQAVDLVLEVKGVPVPLGEEPRRRLAEGLGLPVYDETGEPAKVLRVALAGSATASWAGNLALTTLATSGTGLLLGVSAATGFGYAPWNARAVAIGAGAGFLLGLGSGPFIHHTHMVQFRALGYHPWRFHGKLLVLLPGVDGGSATVTGYSLDALDPGPHLKPLPPERRSEAEIRAASLAGYLEALVLHLRAKGLLNRPQP